MTLPSDLDAVFGPRVDKAVNKVGGLLPVEWTDDLRDTMRDLVADAYFSGLGQSQHVDGEMRRSF